MTMTVQDDFSKQLIELDKIQETCKKLLATKHYQNLGEAGIHAIIARAKALGIHPFEALNSGFYVVSGRVGMSTEMMMALVRRRGHSITKDAKSNAECVILHGRRADNGDTWTCTFTRQDAEAAGLWNTATWKKYSATMLYNRCASMLFRQLFPDLSLGAGYVEDELREITKTGDYQQSLPVAEFEVKTEPKKAIDAPVSCITPEQADELATIMSQTSQTFQDKIYEWMTSAPVKLSSYAEFSPKQFASLIPNAMADISANAKPEIQDMVEE